MLQFERIIYSSMKARLILTLAAGLIIFTGPCYPSNLLNYDLTSPADENNYSKIDRDEAYNGETLQHNIDNVNSSFRLVAQMELSESLDSLTIQSLLLENTSPLTISDSVNISLQDSVPYSITVETVRIVLSEAIENLAVDANGQFSPSGGSQVNLPIDYYHEGTIEILGAITAFSFSSTGSLDIDGGDFDLGQGGRFLMRLTGKTGVGNTTIFTGTYNEKPISVGLMMDNFVNINGPSIPVYWSQFPYSGYSYVDTGAWLGWLFLDYAPYVWSVQLNKWLIVPDTSAEAGQGWVYWPK